MILFSIGFVSGIVVIMWLYSYGMKHTPEKMIALIKSHQ